MPRISKIVHSREHWKGKATQRAYELREHRKSQQRHLEKIAQLKALILTMKQADDDNKKNSASCCLSSY